MTRTFDAIVIGAGQAGPPLAGRLTASGMKVAIIERDKFGGTCVNTGCMPTKTLVASAYAAHLARRGADYGIVLDQPVRLDMRKVRSRAATVTANASRSVENWLRNMKGCTVFQGSARFEGPKEVRVGPELLSAPRIFINVGGRAVVPDLPGLDEISYLTNSSMLELERVPEHLVVIGGSYIGLEFAQMYRRFGAEVTVVEMGPRLVGREDPDISDAVRDILEKEGIHVRTSAECIRFAKGNPKGQPGIRVGVDCTQGDPEILGSDVLLAVGRRPNTGDLGLDRAGVALDHRGYIMVNEGLQTNVAGIWALGDCNGRGAFTHTAYNDYEIVAANLLDGENRRVSDRVSGYALFIDPPLGRAGMTEAQVRARGKPYLSSTRPMTRVGRAVEKDETLGFMKVLADPATKEILGAAILGTGGDEAIHGILDAMNAKTPYDRLRWAVPIHPTVSELIPTLLLGLQPAPAS
ncbi:MAG: FAD-containing oxidoreductase [Bradyrhizobium sp.]|nr:FAD-containing oxidoreductase [Bradyrhizobium sp.]